MLLYLFLIFILFFFSCLELFTIEIKKKYFKIIQKIFIFIIFLLFIFNRNNNDYKNYLEIFNSEIITIEKGYIFLIKFVKIFGYNHNFILLILGVLLTFTIFYLYGIRYQITFIFLYFIYTFVYDINQVRNLFCILFVLIGFKMLQKNKKILYIAFNVLGISFQQLGWIYIIFFLLQRINLKKYIRIIIVLFLGGIASIFIVEKIITIFFPDKAIFYFQFKPKYGVLIYYILIVIDVILLKICINKKKDMKEDIFIKFILFPIIFLPYSSLHLEIMRRIWRNTLYIKWFYFLEKLKNKTKQNKVIIFSFLIFQQIILIGTALLLDLEKTIILLSQITNIKFYF